MGRVTRIDPPQVAASRRDASGIARTLAGAGAPIAELNEPPPQAFRRLGEAYVESGEPVGSRPLTRRLTEQLSPATIRNVMADLQDAGLLFAPHTSAG